MLNKNGYTVYNGMFPTDNDSTPCSNSIRTDFPKYELQCLIPNKYLIRCREIADSSAKAFVGVYERLKESTKNLIRFDKLFIIASQLYAASERNRIFMASDPLDDLEVNFCHGNQHFSFYHEGVSYDIRGRDGWSCGYVTLAYAAALELINMKGLKPTPDLISHVGSQLWGRIKTQNLEGWVDK